MSLSSFKDLKIFQGKLSKPFCLNNAIETLLLASPALHRVQTIWQKPSVKWGVSLFLVRLILGLGANQDETVTTGIIILGIKQLE